MNKYIWLLILWWPLAEMTDAQERVYRFQNYSVDDGLSQSYVTSIIQDKTGYLWFGTADGLNRFDGYTFKVFKRNPADSNTFNGRLIHALLCDNQNRIWIGTRGGLNIYSPVTKKFRHVTAGSSQKLKLPNDYVYALHQTADSSIFIGTGNGVVVYKPRGDSAYIVLSQNSGMETPITSFTEESDGTVWFGGLGAVYRFDRATKGIKVYLLPGMMNENADVITVQALIAVKDGSILAGATGGGLFLLRKGEKQFVQYIPRGMEKQNDKSIRSLITDAEGNIWAGTAKGLTQFSINDGLIRNFVHQAAEKDGLAPGYISALRIDKSGQLWIGTDGGGISKLNVNGKQFYLLKNKPADKNSLSDNFIKAIYKDSAGILWIGTRNGLNRYDEKTAKWRLYPMHTAAVGSNDNLVLEIFEDSHGTLWVGHLEGLSSFNRSTGRFRYYGSKGLNREEKFGVHEIIEMNKDSLLIAAWTGLYVFARASGTFSYVRGNERGGNLYGIPFYALAKSAAGEYWGGTLDSGVFVLDKKLRMKTVFKPRHGDKNTLAGASIKAIYSSGDYIYIATTSGLSVYSIKTGIFENFNELSGFSNTFFYSVLPDEKGNIWLSHNKGISRFHKGSGKVTNFSVEDGLQSNEFNTGAYFKDHTGRIYFGGIGGVTYFHPDSVAGSKISASVVLSEFKIFDSTYFRYHAGEVIRLNADDKVFSFQFFSTDYSDVARNTFAYRLDGFDKDWIYTGGKREVRYTNIEDGSYTFRVKTANAEGEWSSNELEVALLITPPFWKQGWFIFIAVVAVGVLYGSLIRYASYRKLRKKIEALERQKLVSDERSRISRDLHDEIGSQVTQIALFGEILQRGSGHADDHKAAIRNMTETSRRIAESLDNVVWAVNPDNDTIENFIGYLEQYIYKTLDHASIGCRLDILIEFAVEKISADIRHNILMVIKELVNNIIKHSGASLVHFTIRQEGHMVVMVLSDNGKGFVADEVRQYSNGLKNMKKRVEYCKGTFEMYPGASGGTEAKMVLPLRNGE